MGNEKNKLQSLQFKVLHSSINMRRCVVHFRDGSVQEVSLRQNIRAGGASRVINLKGNKRIIAKVVFWYDTKNNQRGRGVLSLWGRR